MLAKISRCFLLVALVVLIVPRTVMAQTETLSELYKKALKEEGVLNCYCTLAQINAEKIFPVFEKRFPGIKINHVDATSDKLAARAITEARGGKTLADVVEFGLQDLNKIHEQGLILEKVPPEAAAYPANLKGSYWVANNLIFIVGAWNTEKVKKQEEPKSLDDFGDPRWQGRLIAEPRDYEPVVGLMHKHKSLDKAREVLTKIAANNVEFHQGHSQLAELLVAGQAAACFTCYSHHYPARVKKGAPVDYMRSEGIADIIALAVLKAPPHPNTAWLFTLNKRGVTLAFVPPSQFDGAQIFDEKAPMNGDPHRLHPAVIGIGFVGRPNRGHTPTARPRKLLNGKNAACFKSAPTVTDSSAICAAIAPLACYAIAIFRWPRRWSPSRTFTSTTRFRNRMAQRKLMPIQKPSWLKTATLHLPGVEVAAIGSAIFSPIWPPGTSLRPTSAVV